MSGRDMKTFGHAIACALMFVPQFAAAQDAPEHTPLLYACLTGVGDRSFDGAADFDGLIVTNSENGSNGRWGTQNDRPFLIGNTYADGREGSCDIFFEEMADATAIMRFVANHYQTELREAGPNEGESLFFQTCSTSTRTIMQILGNGPLATQLGEGGHIVVRSRGRC